MVGLCPLSNPIRAYAWGSHSAIAQLLGQPVPSSEPQAELWMGAHPSDPSRVACGDRWIPLNEILREDPIGVLGARAADHFAGRLPFLFKVLAVDQPLSVQAHPDADQAREGFASENARGIELDAPKRNYRDPHPKPELLCALTPFWALCGFRACETIVSGFRALQIDEFAREVEALELAPDAAGLERWVGAWLAAEPERAERAVAQARDGARSGNCDDLMARWILALGDRYPKDVGALAPIFLNVIRLAPGDAMYLGAGKIHCYLQGVGVEVMGNSDNVLRGGLTQKHIDVPEFLRVLRFEVGDSEILRPRPGSAGEAVFDTPAAEFELATIHLEAGRPWSSRAGRGVEILLLVEGTAEVTDIARGESHTLDSGGSILVPDSVERYELSGRGVLYRVGIPRS